MSKPTLVPSTDVSDVNPQQVAEYLKQTPEFFVERPLLLNQLTVPHPQTGNAVSLVERQVAQLQKTNRDLQTQLGQLVGVAHENHERLEQLNALQLGLLDAADVPDFLLTLESHLREKFDCGIVRAILVGEKDNQAEAALPAFASTIQSTDEIHADFKDFIANDQPLCGRLRPTQLEWLLGEQADGVQSAAVIPLGKNCEVGLITLASDQADRFNPAQGTVFLSYLGKFVERVLVRTPRSA